MAITDDSKNTLKEKIGELNKKIDYWQEQLDIYQQKKIHVIGQIAYVQGKIDGLKAEKQNLKNDAGV